VAAVRNHQARPENHVRAIDDEKHAEPYGKNIGVQARQQQCSDRDAEQAARHVGREASPRDDPPEFGDAEALRRDAAGEQQRHSLERRQLVKQDRAGNGGKCKAGEACDQRAGEHRDKRDEKALFGFGQDIEIQHRGDERGDKGKEEKSDEAQRPDEMCGGEARKFADRLLRGDFNRPTGVHGPLRHRLRGFDGRSAGL
jgi:hypothetical protein